MALAKIALVTQALGGTRPAPPPAGAAPAHVLPCDVPVPAEPGDRLDVAEGGSRAGRMRSATFKENAVQKAPPTLGCERRGLLAIPKSSKNVFQGTLRGIALCVLHAFHPKVSQPPKRHSTTFKVRSATCICSTAFSHQLLRHESAKVLTSGGSNDLSCSRTRSERRIVLSST